MSYDLIIDNYKRSRDWTIKKSEFLRLIFLLMIPLIIFWPMFYGIDIGASDANFYQQLAADALEQYKHHIFPIYVGQSVFDFTGTPLGRAPYYLILVGIINLFTFGKLNSLQIEHATILFSAIAGIYLIYFALRKLIPERRWAAFVFAVFYITSPGILSQIVRLDMYYSYMVVPYVPILFYALVRTYQKNDWLSYVLIAASLSIIQMAHPFVALWSMMAVGLFFLLRFIEKPQIIFKLLVSGILFVLFSLWQLVTVHSLKLGPVVYTNANNLAPKEHVLHHAQELISQYKTYFFGYFKPVNLTADGFVCIQLGYSLWIALLFGLYIVIKKRPNRLLMYLLSCAFFLLIWVYPIPFISLFCWSHVPYNFTASTYLGNERVAMILPALICFIGILALSQFNSTHKTTNRILNISLLIMLSWSFYQSVPFTRYLIQYLYLDNTWLYPENAYHRVDYPSGALYQGLKTGIYEPAMFNRLLTPEGQVIEKFDNKKAFEAICRSRTDRGISNNISEKMVSIPTNIKLTADGVVLPLMKVKIQPGIKYLFCFDLIASNGGGTFAVQGKKHETLNSFFSPSLESQMLIIPTSTIGNKEKELKITVVPGAINSKGGFLNIKSFGMIPYHADSLPIKFHSIIPYKVTVNNPIQFAYLETAKQFFDGYKAIVNGAEIPVKESPSGRVMIPLGHGNNEVKLIYKGTLLSQISFYISLFSWASLAIYLAYRFSNRKDKITTLGF